MNKRRCKKRDKLEKEMRENLTMPTTKYRILKWSKRSLHEVYIDSNRMSE